MYINTTPSTPHLENFLDTRPNSRKPNTPFLLQLAQFALTMNNVSLQNHTYLQIKSTAMGTHMALFYANLFIGRLEIQYLTPHFPNLSPAFAVSKTFP